MITLAELNEYHDRLTELHAHCLELFRRYKTESNDLNYYSQAIHDAASLELPVEEGLLTWFDYDHDGDRVFMQVPVDVAYGERSVEQWAADAVAEKERRLEQDARNRAIWTETRERAQLAKLLARYGAPE